MSAQTGLVVVKKAIEVRRDITKIYSEYNRVSNQLTLESEITKADFKRAVDALYYLGGGWPHPNSKGRLETLLDNFVNVYRILDFVGEGHVVVDYLRDHGISIKLKRSAKILNKKLKHDAPSDLFNEPEDLRDLASQAMMICMTLQKEICGLADDIKFALKPAAKKELGVEDEEYDRLFGIVRMKVQGDRRSEKISRTKKLVVNSVANFQTALDLAAQEKMEVEQ